MTTRAERIGKYRPWQIHRAPLPRDWWGILAELENELGVELAMIVRRIRLMAIASAEVPVDDLFRTEHDHPELIAERQVEALALITPDVRPELQTLLSVATRQAPRPSEIAASAEVLAEWAQHAGYAVTALNLAEAGAAIAPANAWAAFVAARTNRQIGEAWRAEVFYRTAITNACHTQDWRAYVRAQLGFGTLLMDRGHLAAAARRFKSAARVAVDQGSEWLAAQTFHDLAGLQFQRGDLNAAVNAVMKALSIYPRGNERMPIAVHDLAFLLMLRGYADEALPLLELLEPLPLLPRDQVLVAGTLARVAGSMGRVALYESAAERVAHYAENHKEHADAAYVNLAHGARALGRWAVAAEHAGKAARLAAESRHRFVEQVAWELLAEVAARKTGSPPSAPLLRGTQAADLIKLMATLRDHLGGWRINSEQYGPDRLAPSNC
jgi:tetratricopeptide (TPR) repeat protein